jgi:hypothetical protein
MADDTLKVAENRSQRGADGKMTHSFVATGSLNSPDTNVDAQRGQSFAGELKFSTKLIEAARKKAGQLLELMEENGLLPSMAKEWKDSERIQGAKKEDQLVAYLLAKSMGSSLQEKNGKISGSFDGALDAADYKANNELVLKAAAQILKDNGLAKDIKIAPESSEASSDGCGKPMATPGMQAKSTAASKC